MQRLGRYADAPEVPRGFVTRVVEHLAPQFVMHSGEDVQGGVFCHRFGAADVDISGTRFARDDRGAPRSVRPLRMQVLVDDKVAGALTVS